MTFAFMTSFIPIAYIYNLLPISKVALSFSFAYITLPFMSYCLYKITALYNPAFAFMPYLSI